MGRKNTNVCVDEEVRIATHRTLKRFMNNPDRAELEFPSSLTSTERAFVHRLCSELGLASKSKGRGTNRHLTVKRKQKGDSPETATLFIFGQNSSRVLHSLLHRWPVKQKERMDLQPKTSKLQPGVVHDYAGFRPDASKTSGRLNNGIPQVPTKRGPSNFDAFRQTLPISGMAIELVSAINKHPAVLICGETGAGKTTQISQFILDDCHAKGEPCRILCTQPRRISAVAVAERVAAERGECVGQMVGYQIRLESRVSPRTLLTFCTNGVLLRTLMAGDNSLSTVTHVIVDEVHERDKYCDFLLIKLRQLCKLNRSGSGRTSSPRYPKFRLVLMSASLDIDLFVDYFSNCPVINIPGNMYPVQEYFLEDVLQMTGYMKSKEPVKKTDKNEDTAKTSDLDEITEEFAMLKVTDTVEPVLQMDNASILKNDAMDDALYALWHKASLKNSGIDDKDENLQTPFNKLFHLIKELSVSVNYRHSETGITALMASAMHGATDECEQLLDMGAEASLQVANGWTAANMAVELGHEELGELIASYIAGEQNGNISKMEAPSEDTEETDESSNEMSEEERHVVSVYQQSFDDDNVDLDLIMQLVHVICQKSEKGAILIFLPGYDDIVTLRELILSQENYSQLGSIKLFVLHSSMQSSADQKQVFKAPPKGTRKIILSTNIAETSITIDDVVYVVDAGKVKIKVYEAMTSTSALKSVWISKSSALQRKGRAGRCKPGICFHLFSKARYSAMTQFQTAELLRTPLHELCLQAKLLSMPPKKRRSRSDGGSELDDSKTDGGDSIVDFLSQAPEPPSRIMLDSAVSLLKTIDALDAFEDLTELGHHLVDLPIEPNLGKMVLYSVVLKCLDPVLTIACALAYKDPFLLPRIPDQKTLAMNCRIKFAAGAFSDHMCLLRTFQAWQKAKSDGWEKSFCDRNFLSSATMQMIIGMRTQLLGQLRAAGFVRARGGSDIRDLNTNSENWAVVKAALCASAFPNLLKLDGKTLKCKQHKKVRLHNSSVLVHPRIGKKYTHAEALCELPTNWLVYDELTAAPGHFSGLATARCCTAVTPACIALFAGPSYLSPTEAIIEPDFESNTSPYAVDSDSDTEDKHASQYSTLLITDWIRLKMEPQLAEMMLDIRVKWHSLLLRRIRAPAKSWLPEDESVLSTIINILSSEDQSHNLLQPSGIGQRPRPMSQEDGSNQRGFPGVRPKTPSKRNTITNSTVGQLKNNKPLSQSDSLSKVSSSRLSSSLSVDGSSSGSSPCLSPQPKLDKNSNTLSPVMPLQTKYLAVVCNSQKNVHISQRNGIWITSSNEEKIFSAAFNSSAKVFLVVFLQDCTFFQGYARMSSPVAPFSWSLESDNLGWERDEGDSSADLTAYFSVEWINKSSKLIEGFVKKSGVENIWEMDSTERIIMQYENSITQLAPVPQSQNYSLCSQGPYSGSCLPFAYPGINPANMSNINPCLNPPSLNTQYPQMSIHGQYSPYQYTQHPRSSQPMLYSSASHQCHSYNYLRQNK